MITLPFTYTYDYKSNNDGDKTVIGCTAKIFPSFLRNRNRKYDARTNKYMSVDNSRLRGGIGD
jgi:hypothetical protein